METTDIVSSTAIADRSRSLLAAQHATLAAPRRRHGLAARALFCAMDVAYGRPATLAKFRVLEVIARVPYQAWEQVAYIAITHAHRDTGFALRTYERVKQSRDQQDNEQWHLFVLEELLGQSGRRLGWVRHRMVPQLIAFGYYQLSCVLYVVWPGAAYRLNADFEDHAEHEYMRFVLDHPELDRTAWSGPALAPEHAEIVTLGDLFRQIGLDERHHKEESIALIGRARFH